MKDDLASWITIHIAELEELRRQLAAGESDAATLLSLERLEQSIGLFRSMLNEVGASTSRRSDQA